MIDEKENPAQQVPENIPAPEKAQAPEAPAGDRGNTGERSERSERGDRGGQRRRESRRPKRERTAQSSEFIEKVIAINRVTKVTKGGKKMSFSALVVIGDGKGHVGYNLGKSNEVAGAIKKAIMAAKKEMVKIPMKGFTIPHLILGKCGAAQVMLKPALEGTGVIAAGPVRAICDAAGIRDILTKCHKSNNPINVVKATMDGLARLKSATLKPEVLEQEEGQHAAA